MSPMGWFGAAIEAAKVGLDIYRAARGDDVAIVRAHMRMAAIAARAKAAREKAKKR